MRLQNKVAIITGGSRGIGYATADAFLREGAVVIITASTQASADKAVARLREKYPNSTVAGISPDLSSLESVRNAFLIATAQYGCVDILVNNAGVSESTPFMSYAEEDFDRDQWYVIAQDGPDGVVLTLSYSDNLRKVRKWGEETSGLNLTDGLIRQFIYRHGWMGDGDTLFVMTFTPEQGAELERSMAQTNGWHRFPTHELINRIFFHKSSYCRDLSGKNYLPSVENGWYFFRDTFNVQHGEDDENQWNLDGRAHLPGNFDAGIYDSDTCTLYLFEFDS